MSNHDSSSSFSPNGMIAPLFLLAIALSGADSAHASTIRQDACGLTDIPEAEVAMRIPFEVVDGRIYVQARVNGYGPMRFGVDTGASGMARADASLVSSLGLAVKGQSTTSDGVQDAEVDMTHLDSVQLGNLTRRNLDVITRDYGGHMSSGAAFSGIIAREFFADGLLVIDYPDRTLSFSRTRSLSPAQKNVLSYQRAFRIPVSIGELRTEGNLDTGANVTFVLPRSLYEKVAASRLERAGRGQLTNGVIETGRAVVPGPFRVGSATLSDVEVRVSDDYPELLIGSRALQDLVLVIDQRSKSVAICK
ncbi:MAG: aspartyl protease family protein [Luteimonas sp.]|nr:aspartyl protease family protein [Luteimonas sp.]